MTRPSVVVGIVARNRYAQLVRCIESAFMCSGDGVDLTVRVVFDGDTKTPTLIPRYPGCTYISSEYRLFYVRAANFLVDHIMRATHPDGTTARPDYFVITDDDTQFTGYPWAEIAIKRHREWFPRGVGVIELVDVHECCHFMTTPATVEHLGGKLYDPCYIQFFHDTALHNTLRSQNLFAFVGVDGQNRRMVAHHRDTMDGAGGMMQNVRDMDYQEYMRQSERFGWSVYSVKDPRHGEDKCEQQSSRDGEPSPSGSPSGSTSNSQAGS